MNVEIIWATTNIINSQKLIEERTRLPNVPPSGFGIRIRGLGLGLFGHPMADILPVECVVK